MKHKVYVNNVNKFLKSYNECIAYGCFIEDTDDLIQIFEKAKDMKILRQYNEDVFFCNALTKFMDKDAVISLFIIGLNKDMTELDMTQQIINIIDLLENVLNVSEKSVKKVINVKNNSTVCLLKIISIPV